MFSMQLTDRHTVTIKYTCRGMLLGETGGSCSTGSVVEGLQTKSVCIRNSCFFCFLVDECGYEYCAITVMDAVNLLNGF